MKYFAAIPVKGRKELVVHTIQRLLKIGVDVYCMGDYASDQVVCENAGAKWVYALNEPLGRKWNAGIKAALKSKTKYDGFLFVGSSDWVCELWPYYYGKYLEEYDMVGTLGNYYLDVYSDVNIELVLWKGYSLHDPRELMRYGEPTGIGRMYSMRILKILEGDLFPEHAIAGMDAGSLANLIKYGGTMKAFESDEMLPCVSISTNKWENKHSFKDVKKQLSSVIIPEEQRNLFIDRWFPEARKIF